MCLATADVMQVLELKVHSLRHVWAASPWGLCAGIRRLCAAHLLVMSHVLCLLQIAAFFAADGAAVTNPGSLLHLSIYPSYYNAVTRVCLAHI